MRTLLIAASRCPPRWHYRDMPERRCHTVITDGKIAFQADCYHSLAGKTVEMPDWKGW